MPNYSRNDVILVDVPYSNAAGSKVRPAVVVSDKHTSQDILFVPLTSQVNSLLIGEFALSDWGTAGLRRPTAVKRGIYTVQASLILKHIGKLSIVDTKRLNTSLLLWLALP